MNQNLIRGLIAAYAALLFATDLVYAHDGVSGDLLALFAVTQVVGLAILALIARALP